MSCGALSSAVQKSLVCTLGITSYEWFTPWLPCTGIDKFKAVLKNKNDSGDFESQVATQFAAVRTDNPDAPSTHGSALQDSGEYCTGEVDISSAGSTKFYVRFGVAFKVYGVSPSVPARANVELQVAYETVGQVLAPMAAQLSTTTTANQFVAVSSWVPVLNARKVKAAVVVNSLTDNFRWQLAYRVATTSKQVPGAWSTNFQGGYNTSGEFNTGELTPSGVNDMWVQFGIQYNASASGNGQASVTAAVAVRR